jgi:hypothetical protein
VLPGLNIVITVSLSESLSGVVELHPTDEDGNRRPTSAGDNFSSRQIRSLRHLGPARSIASGQTDRPRRWHWSHAKFRSCGHNVFVRPMRESSARPAPRPLWRRLLKPVLVIAALVVVFGWLLPQFIDYEQVWQALSELAEPVNLSETRS